MTLLEPMWLAIPALASVVLLLGFAWAVRWSLAAHPVMPLNHVAESAYRRPALSVAPTPRSLDFYQNFGPAMATSSYSLMTPERHARWSNE